MKDTLRRLRVHTRERFKQLRISSDEGDSASVEGQVASDQIRSDSRQSHTEIPQQEDQVNVAEESEDASMSTTQPNADPPSTENMDFSNVWPEAYENVKRDPQHLELLQKLEKFLESEDGDLKARDPKPPDNPSEATHKSQLEAIQKNAEQRLKTFSEAHLSFTIRDQPIVVRESILKAVQVINTLKPIISGAVAAEPTAALAWAGVTTILPILENVFQQDEDAATGLTNVIFLMARYQGFHEQDFVSHLQSSCQSNSSRKSLSHVRGDLVSVYGKIYIYEARFVLQYGGRNKMHRALRNALNADGWKQLWLEIETISTRIDQGVNAEVSITTLKSWQVVTDIQERTERIEVLQHETLKVVQGFDRRQLLQSLQVTGNAVFDSRRTSKVEAVCLPGTQRHILQTIQDWTDDPDSTMIFWLQGMAGTGKTSIALTVASSLEARVPFTDPLKRPSRAFLGASFFFAQGDATRNNTAEFFRTIAWCLADALPDVGVRIAEAIKDNPGIHTKAPQQQLQKLIIKPLELLDQKTFVPLQLVVVIDALDECLNEDAEDLLGMLENLEKLYQIQLRLFITSRREGHISMAMENLPSRLFQTNRLNKVDSSPGSNNDIVFYLSKSLGSIATRWRVTDGGVSGADINRLAEKADGLFIYAATACRFLDSRHFVNKGFRDRRLNLFFQDQWETEGPQHTIDDIYVKVLTFPETEGWSVEEKSVFHTGISQVIGFIVVLFRPASMETLSYLLPTETRDDLKYYLGQLHSIIDVPEDPEFPLLLVHLSFRDFILDQQRSGRLPFFIDELAMHREVLYRCFALMDSELREDICSLNLPGSLVSDVHPSHIACHIPRYLQYACRYWVDHLIQADGKLNAHTGPGDAEYETSAALVYIMLKEKLLYWLEVMAFIGEASSIIPKFSQLETFVERSENPYLQSLLHDAKRFVLNNRWIIEHAPLQMYCAALLFCPKESLVRSYYQSMIPAWITKKPEVQQTWPVELSTLEGHTSGISNTAFSPTEILLASASFDCTTRLWDYVTGSEVYRFKDPGQPLRVCFSMDGSRIASGCLDGTICVRDFRKGTKIILRSSSFVAGLSFSPTDSNILASLSGMTLRVWDVKELRQLVTLRIRQGPQVSLGITFSPDAQLVAVHLKGRISLCNVKLGRVVNEFLPPCDPMETIQGLSISADHRIVALRFHETIHFWDMVPLNPKLIKTYKATWSDCSLFMFISPDEMIKVCPWQDQTQMVDLFDLATGESIGTFLKTFVKQDPNEGPLGAISSHDYPLIRIFSYPSTSALCDIQEPAPRDVELMFDSSMAMSYSYGMEQKQWNVADGSAKPFHDHVRAVIRSHDERLVLLQLNEGDEFQVWDKSLTQRIAAYTKLACMDFVPQTSHLVSLSLSGDLEILSHDPKNLTIESVKTLELADVFFESIPEMRSERAKPLYVSPNGEVVAVILACHDDNRDDHYDSLQLWNIARGEMIQEIQYHTVRQIVFSSDSRYVGVEYEYSPLNTQLLNISNGTAVEDCNFQDGSSLTFHPSGRMLGIVSQKHKDISVWKGTPWVRYFTVRAPEDLKVRNLVFSRTNKLVILSTSVDSGSVIEIWDTITKQRIGSQNLMLKGFAISLRLSKNETFLESNRGRLPLPTQEVTDTGSEESLDDMHKYLYVLDDWVYQGRERLIWLPPSYRPTIGKGRNVDVQGDTIAIAHERNSVKFIGISLEETPVAKHYLSLRSS